MKREAGHSAGHGVKATLSRNAKKKEFLFRILCEVGKTHTVFPELLFRVPLPAEPAAPQVGRPGVELAVRVVRELVLRVGVVVSHGRVDVQAQLGDGGGQRLDRGQHHVKVEVLVAGVRGVVAADDMTQCRIR